MQLMKYESMKKRKFVYRRYFEKVKYDSHSTRKDKSSKDKSSNKVKMQN